MASRKQPRFDPQSMDSQFATVISEIKGLRESVDTKLTIHGTRLTEIHGEVKATNGRVTALEGWRASVTARIAGAIAVLGFAGGILGFAVQVWASR